VLVTRSQAVSPLIPWVRFAAVSGAGFAISWTWPATVLTIPGWVLLHFAAVCGDQVLGPARIDGPAIVLSLSSGMVRLEDPYLLAGLPLYLALWCLNRSSLRALPWRRVLAGTLVLEIEGGVVWALVFLSIQEGFLASPGREPLELLALVSVAGIRVSPLLAWLVLDPESAVRTLLSPSLRRTSASLPVPASTAGRNATTGSSPTNPMN
jgi:hypothetical protein